MLQQLHDLMHLGRAQLSANVARVLEPGRPTEEIENAWRCPTHSARCLRYERRIDSRVGSKALDLREGQLAAGRGRADALLQFGGALQDDRQLLLREKPT